MRPRGGCLPHGSFRPATLIEDPAFIKEVLAVAAIAYLAVAAIIWATQERLIFFPQPAFGAPRPPAGWSLETVAFAAADGTHLRGVLAKPPGAKPALVLYFPGNAEEATVQAAEANRYGERAVLLMNYRGYGQSEGKPGERALVGDAIELFDWASKRADLDTARVAVHGRSLGTGIAVQLAAARPVKAVILTSPYDTLAAVAGAHYPWLPTSLLLRHRFDSLARAPSLRMPALILVAGDDTLVAPAHSARLAGAWGGPVERVTIDGHHHNNMELDPRYGAAILEFLARHS